MSIRRQHSLLQDLVSSNRLPFVVFARPDRPEVARTAIDRLSIAEGEPNHVLLSLKRNVNDLCGLPIRAHYKITNTKPSDPGSPGRSSDERLVAQRLGTAIDGHPGAVDKAIGGVMAHQPAAEVAQALNAVRGLRGQEAHAVTGHHPAGLEDAIEFAADEAIVAEELHVVLHVAEVTRTVRIREELGEGRAEYRKVDTGRLESLEYLGTVPVEQRPSLSVPLVYDVHRQYLQVRPHRAQVSGHAGSLSHSWPTIQHHGRSHHFTYSHSGRRISRPAT